MGVPPGAAQFCGVCPDIRVQETPHTHTFSSLSLMLVSELL